MSKEIIKELLIHQKTAKDKGYIVFGTYLQGSQNYGLQTENSDIDTKTIVVPSFKDFARNRAPISTTHVLPDNSHDDQKDVRLMFETFLKQNLNFLEILFTSHFVVESFFEDEHNELIGMADKIANYNKNQLFRCTLGMALSKRKNMNYCTTMNNLGYNPKDFHHILRIEEFMQRFISGEPFKDCLKAKNKDYLISVKKGEIPLFEASELADKSLEKIIELKEKHSLEKDACDLEVAERLNELSYKIIKKAFKRELGDR